MKKTSIVLLFLAVIVSSAAQNESIEKIIRQMDQKNAAMIVKADSAEMVGLLAAQFTLNRSTGAVVSGINNTLQLFRSGAVSYDSFSVQTEFVLVNNPASAVSMGSEVVILGGRSQLAGQIVRRRFTHVWIKENGSWKLLARHANNICTP